MEEGSQRLGRWVPGLVLARGLRGPALRRDVVAGAVLAALLVPQGMAYAELAGVRPVTGLYATLVPLVVYFLLGPSPILVWRDARGPQRRAPGGRVALAFAELNDPVRERLRRYGIEDAIGADRFFPTLGVAVAAYLGETGVDWQDWEERPPRGPARPSGR